MATIVTRSGKGAALSAAEMDANLTNLNNDKIELSNISVTTAADGESSALSYNNTTGVFTFTPVVISDLIGLVDLSVGTPGAASGSGSLAYDNLTGVFTYTPPDLSSYGTLSNVVEDTTPQLGGNLDVQTSNIFTSTTNGSIGLAPNGTGAVNITSGVGLNIAPNAGASKIFTSSNGNLVLDPDGTGVIKLGKNLDVEARAITTSTTNGDLKLSANGSGKVAIEGGSGIDLKSANTITTTTAATDLNISATGYISLNSNTIFGAGFEETVYSSTTTTGTYAPSISNGTIHYVAMTGNMTINAFTSPVAGQTISLLFDGTGGTYTLTLGANILKPGGAIALTAGGMDIVTITCVDDITPVYVAVAVNDLQ